MPTSRRKAYDVTPHDNGCLAAIPGALVAQALNRCDSDSPAERPQGPLVQEVTVPHLGRVLIVCQRQRDPRWKRWFWHAVRADRVD